MRSPVFIRPIFTPEARLNARVLAGILRHSATQQEAASKIIAWRTNTEQAA